MTEYTQWITRKKILFEKLRLLRQGNSHQKHLVYWISIWINSDSHAPINTLFPQNFCPFTLGKLSSSLACKFYMSNCNGSHSCERDARPLFCGAFEISLIDIVVILSLIMPACILDQLCLHVLQDTIHLKSPMLYCILYM